MNVKNWILTQLNEYDSAAAIKLWWEESVVHEDVIWKINLNVKNSTFYNILFGFNK